MLALFVGAAIISGLGLEELTNGREANHSERIHASRNRVLQADGQSPLLPDRDGWLDIVGAYAISGVDIANATYSDFDGPLNKSESQAEPISEPTSVPVVQRTVLTVQLTIYVCENAPPGQSYCGTMASGKRVYEGAAACGDGLALGTRFRFDREYVCEDRGNGPAYWVDIFHWDYYAGQAWRKQYGETVEIEVVGE